MYVEMLLGRIWGLFSRGAISNQEWYAFIFRIALEESDSEIDTAFVNPHRTSHHVICGFIVACCMDCRHFLDLELLLSLFANCPECVAPPPLQSRGCYKC